MSADGTPFWHCYADEDGTSRQAHRRLVGHSRQSMGGDADPQWNLPMERATKVIQAIMPVGFAGDWHENPAPQWIAVLSGCWFVETMDGTRVEMGAGDLSFGGDQGTADGRGHRSGAVGNEPCCVLIVQFDEIPDAVRNAERAEA